ncbi:MAG: hypothetical protein ACI814_000924 [Mariniblastus sp.]|jgi:hypothetical protein
MHRYLLAVFAACFLLNNMSSASSPREVISSPRLTIIQPRGVQRGVEHVLTFSGSNLGDAEEVFFYEKGFEAGKVEVIDANNVKVTVKVTADCRLGEHVAQVRTKTGVSDFRTFFVGALKAVDEAEPNSDFGKPQSVELNVTVQGIVLNEDVDYFLVNATKGQRISVEVEAMRLGNTLFDPYVAILDAKRFELASNDDTPLALQDAYASVLAPEDGQYVIEVRESAYAGSAACQYRLHIGTFPRPTAVFPAGGKMGENTEVRFLGDPNGETTQEIVLPSEPDSEYGLLAQDDGGVAPSANLFRLFENGNAVEVEPNNDVATATPVTLPLAFNGIIAAANDVDFFKFAAKKGQVFDIECFARRIRSGLDPVINVHNSAGGVIAGNDDSRGPDSYYRFSVPADGEYLISVKDHLGRGASDFVYRLEFGTVKPKLTLSIPRIERYGQYRQQIFVARGNRFATLINATRENFAGEVILDGADLPAGVTMHAEPMAANLNAMPVVFEAAADAPIAGKLVDFTGKHADPTQNIKGGFFNRADFVISAPGQSRYTGKDVHQLAVVVVEELPFSIEIVAPKVPLVRNGEMNLKILAHKKEGWDEPINVQIPFRPTGVGAASSINIPKGQSEVLYPITATGNAQIKNWKIYALGSANVGGAAWASSPLTPLEVADSFVKLEIQRASTEQGKDAQIYCKLSLTTPFEGVAKVRLLGVPPNVTTTELEFNKETTEVAFDLKTAADSPVGKHNLVCQVEILRDGESMISRAGTAELQIDKPLPPPPNQVATPPVVKAPIAPTPAAQPVAPAAVADKPKPKPKPLTRLQKLRLLTKQLKENQANSEGMTQGEAGK